MVVGGERARETVEEWLRCHGCHGTLAALHAELGAFEEAQESLACEPAPSFEWTARASKRMLELFDGARRRLFWTAWEKFVPSAVRETDPDLLRLESDLHAYFVAAALSPPKLRDAIEKGEREGGGDSWTLMAEPTGLRGGEEREAIEGLKSHLAGRGRALVESGECAHYCALAVLGRPWDSSQLKELFQPVWSSTLRNKVSLMLPKLLRAPPEPKLASLLSGGPGGLIVGDDAALHSALALASDLLAKLNVVMSEAGMHTSEANGRDVEHFRGRLTALMADSAQRMGKGGQARASSGLVAAVLGSGDDTRIAIGVGLQEAGAPDFGLNLSGPKGVREALAQTDSSLKAALLQALRWRVLRRVGAAQVKAVEEYVDADLLDAQAGCGLVHSLLTSPNARVQQQAARFLECLSRQAQGRTYLMRTSALLEQVMTVMKRIEGDTRTRRALLRCLQQCSRRSAVQDASVAAGVVEWIAAELYAQAETMSEESAEYMTALLVNLAQRAAGRQACIALVSRLLPLLVDLLEHESMTCREYVHGVLYTLLKQPKYMAQAQSMGLEDILEALQQIYKAQGSSSHARQVTLLLQRLREEEPPEAGPQSDSEDELPPASPPSSSPTKSFVKAGRKGAVKGDAGRGDTSHSKAPLYAEGPEDGEDVVPDDGVHGRGAHLLFKYFVAAGTSLAAVVPARAAATSLPPATPAPTSSPHAGIQNKSSALTSPHKTPHYNTSSSPGRARASGQSAHASPAGRHSDNKEGGVCAAGILGGVTEEEVKHGEEPYADDALDGEADARVGEQSMRSFGEHGPLRFDGIQAPPASPPAHAPPRRLRTPSQDTLKKISELAGTAPSVQEFKEAFGGSKALARTPPRLY